MEKAVGNVSALAIASKVEIINEVKSSDFVKGIPAYLESVLLNFLTNGIKYRAPDRHGFIKVSTETNREFIIVRFQDNGLGIDLKRHGAKLFGMYKTFHANAEARGIGLFITKNQVEVMGGRIEVESQENVGTTFKVYLRHEEN